MSATAKKYKKDLENVEVKLGRKSETKRDPLLAKAIVKAYDLHMATQGSMKNLNDLKKDMIFSRAKQYLPEGVETVTLIAGGIECKLTFGKQRFIPLVNISKLKSILKSTFGLLVKEKTNYTPTPKLLEKAEENLAIRKLLSEKEKSPAITWKMRDQGE